MNNETMHCPGCCDQVGCIGNDLHICKNHLETQRSKDIKKISYMFPIPEEDIYKALGAKEGKYV